MTDELEHTRNVERPTPPALVEPPAPAKGEVPKPASTPEPAPAAALPVDTASGTPEPRRPYRLKMADGVVVNLDLTVYLGRRPSVPRVASDRRVRLVAVPSAEKEVSATHLELRLTGDAVVATDMRSTNGSTVIVPGSKPRTLLRGESAVVTPGTLIDLGDGNLLEVLSPERLTLEEAEATG
ncbi:MAG: FHA domain-containing protein [Pseudolysinimonas sp.]